MLAHVGEAILIMSLIGLAGLEFWIRLAVGLSLLSAVTALGGLRLFGPCVVIVGGGLLVQGREAVAGEVTAAARKSVV